MKFLVTPEGGFIGPLWWRNKSPVLRGQIPGMDGWIDHYFTLHGDWGIGHGSDYTCSIEPHDIEIHLIKDSLEEIPISALPKVFVKGIKMMLIKALTTSILDTVRFLQVDHLNNCLKSECQLK